MSQRPIDIGRSRNFGRRPYQSGREFSARQTRQGRIVLDTPLRRAVFIAGLGLAVLVALALVYMA
jgi:hypothetical protein